MNGNNNNPKGQHNPHHGQKEGQNPQHGGQQKPGQGHDPKKQGQGNEQKKHGWCSAHNSPKAKCNCE